MILNREFIWCQELLWLPYAHTDRTYTHKHACERSNMCLCAYFLHFFVCLYSFSSTFCALSRAGFTRPNQPLLPSPSQQQQQQQSNSCAAFNCASGDRARSEDRYLYGCLFLNSPFYFSCMYEKIWFRIDAKNSFFNKFCLKIQTIFYNLKFLSEQRNFWACEHV